MKQILQCKGKLLSLHRQKEFSDIQDNTLFILKHKPFTIPRQYYGETPEGKEIFHVHGKLHCLSSFFLSWLPPLGDEEQFVF